MDYYIFVENSQLNGAGQCRQLTKGVINYEVNKELYDDFIISPTKYKWNGKEIILNENYENEQAELKRQYLKEEVNYTLKAEYAYEGVRFTNNTKTLVFETNKESVSLITMTLVAIQSGLQTSVESWKCRELQEPHSPISVDFTSEQFLKLVTFARNMVQQSFNVEKELNEEIDKLSVEDLLDEDYMKTYEEHMKTTYEEKVTRTIEV